MAGTYMPLPVLLIRNRYEIARRLISKRLPNLPEADQTRLSALQLQVSYGRFQADREVTELQQVPFLYRRKREEAWKAVSSLSRQQAMERYLELVRGIIPNWEKEIEFADLEVSPSVSALSSIDVSKVGEPVARGVSKGTQKSMQVTRSVASLPQSRAKGFPPQEPDPRRVTTSFPKLNRLNAGSDISEILRRIKERSSSPFTQSVRESKYYRKVNKPSTPREQPAEQVKAVLAGFLDTLQSGVNFAGETALWSDQAKDALNRLEMTFAALAKMCAAPLSLDPASSSEEIRDTVQPRFTAAIHTLSECERLMSDSSEPCAAYISSVRQDLTATTEALLLCIETIKDQGDALYQDLTRITQIHNHEHAALTLLRDRYYVNDPKYGLDLLKTGKKAAMELEISELCKKLPVECTKEIRKLEENLKIASETVEEMERRRRGLENERGKIRDEIAMVQVSAYQENILLSNMYKDLKKSVGIIQGSESRGLPNEVQLKKELDEIRSEVLVLRKDNEGLKERMREVRRRNSIVTLDES